MGTSFRVPIEAGHIELFTRAIGDSNPAQVRSEPVHGGVLAPPTFLTVADHFDPEFPRRPRAGLRWPEENLQLDRDGRPHALFHVNQSFEYFRHVYSGETLYASRAEPRLWHKLGRRGGRLEFIERTTEFQDRTGNTVARSAWLDVATETDHASLSRSADQRRSTGPPREASVLVENLSRTQLVMYVGASGDFHPLHHDDAYARAHGYPGVFAPGMLVMALAARAVTDRVAAAALTRYEGRFLGQVWPGDTLSASLSGLTEIKVDVFNQSGFEVFTGRAVTKRV